MSIPDLMSATENWEINQWNGDACCKPLAFEHSTSNPPVIKVKIDSQDWGTLTSEPGTTTTGSIDPFRSFTIYYNETEGTLSCYVEDAYPQFVWKTAVLSLIGGTAFGCLIGLACGSPLLGAAAGLAGVTTSVVITHGRQLIQKLGLGGLDQTDGGGSSPTWVANDSGSGLVSNPILVSNQQKKPTALRKTA